MCLPVVPLAIAGAALMAGGMGAQYFGQKKADNAVYNAFNKEQGRQKEFEAEQAAKFQDSLAATQQNLLDPAATKAAEDKRNSVMMAATHGAGPQQGAYLPGSSSAAPVVAAHAAEAGKAANAKTAGLAQALAILGGTNDQFLKTGFDINHDMQSIGQLGGFAQGSRGVLQTEMEAAKQKGQTMRMLGGLAQQIGQMALTHGMGGPAAISPVSAGTQDVLTMGDPALEALFAGGV